MLKIALTALRHTITSEGTALAFLADCRTSFDLSDRTTDLLRCAIVSHLDSVADTVRDAAPAEAFAAGEGGDFTVAPVDGEQAPPSPRTAYPPRLSDSGFELDVEVV